MEAESFPQQVSMLSLTNRRMKEVAHKLGARYKAPLAEGTDYHNVKPGEAIYLWGATGTGKTHLAAWWMFTLPTTKEPSALVVFCELGAELRQAMRTDGEHLVVDHYRKAPFLLLDDLAGGRVTDYVAEATFRILDYRWRNELPTFITSNLSLEELAETWDDRMASRIAGMCRVVKLDGNDKRITKGAR